LIPVFLWIITNNRPHFEIGSTIVERGLAPVVVNGVAESVVSALKVPGMKGVSPSEIVVERASEQLSRSHTEDREDHAIKHGLLLLLLDVMRLG
jgi:hypothetical protein